MEHRWFDNMHPSLRHCWHPVAVAADLVGPGPHPVELLGEHFVLVSIDPDRSTPAPPQPVGGSNWSVLPGTCPHRLAPLEAGQVIDGQLRCGYHGWCFDSTGACVSIPALGADAHIPPRAHLTAAHGVEERYGLIWVTLDEPVTAIPDVPEWTDDRFGHAPMPRQVWQAGAAQMVDNFLDVAHFPFTHLDTIGNPDEIEVGEIEVRREGLRFDARYAHTARSIEQSAATGAHGADVVERVMHFRCWAPHHLRLLIEYGPDGDLLLLFFHQPVNAGSTGLFCLILAENIADGRMSPQQQIDFQFAVGSEDRAMLERLRTTGVPLTPGIESHTRADRTTVELRRLLADLDERFAPAVSRGAGDERQP